LQIEKIFQEEILKNVKEEYHEMLKKGKTIESKFLKVKADPEPFTRSVIEPKIKNFIPAINLHSEIHKTTSLGNLKKPDGFIASKDLSVNKNILIEWEPYNEDLRAKKDHGINQAKLWISDINIGNKNDALVTNGRDWILITTQEIQNEIRVVERELTVKESLKLMLDVYNVEKVQITPIEDSVDITEKFYNWYVALIHSGEYHDKENNKKVVEKDDCLINNILNASTKQEKEEVIRLNFTLLNEYGIINEDMLNYLKISEPEDFYNRVNQLYFECLNTPPNRRENIPKIFESLPYLNGGLFRKKDLDQKGIKIRRKSFIQAIQFLRDFHFKKEYEKQNKNYIIDNTIDPQILGHILEKTIEDRKKSGVYYTPKIITDFMSKEIIENYLMAKIISFLKEREDPQWKYIEKFGDIYDLQKIILRKIYDNIIKPIKICDPAVGSGAFLLNCGEILFDINNMILDRLDLQIDDYKIKKRIIQDNLYGVDIKEAAVDICKLRLWLWIIQKQIQEPLPNIEFNIRKGNSLIGYTNTETIKIDPKDIVSWATKANLTEIFQERNNLIRKYYNALDFIEEKDTKSKIDEISEKFELSLNNAIIKELQRKKVIVKREEIPKINFFHWIMEFSEVFEINNGFDIVIGNPPYFRITEASKLEQQVIGKLGILKKYHHGQGDIYYDFIVRSFELLRENGQLILITSRYWLESAYAKYLKMFLKQKVRILKILDFREELLFNGVNIHNSILYYKKPNTLKNDYKFNVYLFNEENRDEVVNLDILDYVDYVGDYSISKWDSDENWAFVPKKYKNLFLKIKSIKTKLGDDYNCNQYTNCFRKKNKSKLIFEKNTNSVPKQFLRKYLKMGEIKKYSPNFNLIKNCLVIHNKQNDLSNEELKSFLKKNNISSKDIFEIKDDSDKNVDQFEELIYIGYRIPRLFYNFIYVNDNTWIDNTYFISSKKKSALSLKYLVAILNSELYRYYIDIVGKKKEYEIEIGSTFLKNLPILLKKSLTYKVQIDFIEKIEAIVDEILQREKNEEDILRFEQMLNDLVYKLYDINYEEQSLIREYLRNTNLRLFS
jgi:hypothetical protein